MIRKIILDLTDDERTEYERIKRKKEKEINPFVKVPPKHPIKNNKNEKNEDTVTPMIDMLLNGMRKGNKSDQIAAEALIKSLHYKNISGKYLKEYEQKYNEAFKKFEEVSRGLNVIIGPHTSVSIDKDSIEVKHNNKITQRIFFPKR